MAGFKVVRPGGLELPTFWFVAGASRRISNLAGECKRVAGACNMHHPKHFSLSMRSSCISLLVQGWAQNWAQLN